MDFTRKSSTMMLVLLLLLDTWIYGASPESPTNANSSVTNITHTTSSTSVSTSTTSSTSVESSTTTNNKSSSITSVSATNGNTQTSTTPSDSSVAATTTIPSPSKSNNDNQSTSNSTVSSTHIIPQTSTTPSDSSVAAATTTPTTIKNTTTESNTTTVATTAKSNTATVATTTESNTATVATTTESNTTTVATTTKSNTTTVATTTLSSSISPTTTTAPHTTTSPEVSTNSTDVDECTNKTNNCDQNAYCNNTIGSYHCTCKMGYEGNGTNCTDVDECTNKTNCDQNAVCNNTDGSYNCTCKKGYEGNGKNCTDIDECIRGNDCIFNTVCVNSGGNYSCICKPGYYMNGKECVQARFSYVGFVKITLNDNKTSNEELVQSLQVWLTKIFNNITGFSYVEVIANDNHNRRRRRSTKLPENFIYVVHLNQSTPFGNLTTLISKHMESCENECTTTFFNVTTSGIWMGNDSDLCQVNKDCDPLSTYCVASNGTYGCKCRNGFKPRKYDLFDKFCIDVNECMNNTSICSIGKTCVNLPGSWSCNCTDGYVEDPSTKQCTDVCQTKPCKHGGECIRDNSRVFFHCKCSPEWKGHDCSEDNSEADKFRTISIAVGASLGSICFILLIVTCHVCRRKQSEKHPERRPLSTNMNDYEMNENKGTYQIPRAHVSNGDDRPSKMEDKQNTYQIPRAQIGNRDERLYDEIKGGNEINVLDERSIKQDKLEREPLTKSNKESHGGGAENRSFLHEEADRRRSENTGKNGVDYF